MTDSVTDTSLLGNSMDGTHEPLVAKCHCGQVKVTVDGPMVETVTSCNCSYCHSVGLICAYFQEHQYTVEGETDTYVHGDRMIMFHRCKVCGCLTHWTSTDISPSRDRMAVNARLFSRELLSTARVQHFDGLDTWTMRDMESPFPRMDIGCNMNLPSSHTHT